MKIYISFFLFFIGHGTYAQPSCQLTHHFMDRGNLQRMRSADESLRSDTINVLNYSIYLDFTQGSLNLMRGNCGVKFETLMDVTTLSLDLLQLNIDSITFRGNQILYSYNDTLITADFGTTLPSGTVDSLTVYYGGTPQVDPSGWGGFYMVLQYFYNLGVGFESDPHNYGRAWHPCFDNFIERATYDFQILTADSFMAYCNGTQMSVQSVGIGSFLTTWVMGTEIPSYLASVAVSTIHMSTTTIFPLLRAETSLSVWLPKL